jgi:hypothetical protein
VVAAVVVVVVVVVVLPALLLLLLPAVYLFLLPRTLMTVFAYVITYSHNTITVKGADMFVTKVQFL